MTWFVSIGMQADRTSSSTHVSHAKPSRSSTSKLVLKKGKQPLEDSLNISTHSDPIETVLVKETHGTSGNLLPGKAEQKSEERKSDSSSKSLSGRYT